ncbi:MAG: ParB/RepB/Spo0J family partition protein [candidate division Zixibacteria bacterium]|nr:ParB/RepB/Spo0J family partition protein [candidate division Zixibacteria bacterium]MBU1470156.1 ParB/RepB/Spo0J family partition protein [candidate division Zixibacteria bacterium]MBU2626001.1 ParB/RepB/Spo0J family partition protein [candidate division Zixibacteria bacterium]
MAKLALGKGLDALIPVREDRRNDSKFIMLKASEVVTRSSQPRKKFSDKGINELADSIREKGILQPLLVKRANGSYELIAGERRLRAAQVAGLNEVPAIVMDQMTDTESFQLALVENIQREDLTPIEEAGAFQRLLQSGSMTQEELASKVGKDRSTIANSLRLLTLPEQVQELINEGSISAGHARAILAVPDKEKQLEIARKIAESNLSVRELEGMVYGKPRKKRGRSLKLKRPPSEIFEAETMLKRHLQTAVHIRRSLKGGRIEIEFYNTDDLSRLIDLIMGRGGIASRSM